jgi:Arc/MetJ-type ribon-helix-helix transcriptional regulator
MHKDDGEAFADNYAERDQAKVLREQARAGGLRFEAYLPGDMADWLLAQVEQGHFVDPSEAVFAIVKNFIEMEPHRDLRDELLRRILDASIKSGLEDEKAGAPTTWTRCLTSCAAKWSNRAPSRRVGRRSRDERAGSLAHAHIAGAGGVGRRDGATALP